jgi:hypothetical protein
LAGYLVKVGAQVEPKLVANGPSPSEHPIELPSGCRITYLRQILFLNVFAMQTLFAVALDFHLFILWSTIQILKAFIGTVGTRKTFLNSKGVLDSVYTRLHYFCKLR